MISSQTFTVEDGYLTNYPQLESESRSGGGYDRFDTISAYDPTTETLTPLPKQEADRSGFQRFDASGLKKGDIVVIAGKTRTLNMSRVVDGAGHGAVPQSSRKEAYGPQPIYAVVAARTSDRITFDSSTSLERAIRNSVDALHGVDRTRGYRTSAQRVEDTFAFMNA